MFQSGKKGGLGQPLKIGEVREEERVVSKDERIPFITEESLLHLLLFPKNNY